MEDYILETKILEKTDDEKERELFISIFKTKNELDYSIKNFEYAEDDLIDYYTYQIKANRAKFDYLLKKAKDQGLNLDLIRQIELKYNTAI